MEFLIKYTRNDGEDFDVKRVQSTKEVQRTFLLGRCFWAQKSLKKLKFVTTFLHGFGGTIVIPEGTIELLMTLSTYPTIGDPDELFGYQNPP